MRSNIQCDAIESPWRGTRVYVAMALPGFLGIFLMLLSTWRYGVGLSPDSASYISAARSLLAGEGYRYADGAIYTHWPPLFPTLLAIPGLVGIGPMLAARLVNAVAFGGIVFSAGLLFSRCTTSKGTAVLGVLSVLLSVPLLAVSRMAWSEPVFILLAVLFVLILPRFTQTKRGAAFLAISVLVGLACLERYAGVTLIVTGGLVIALSVSKASVLDRLKYSIGFCLLSGAPLALWLLRNRVLAGQTTGAHRLDLTLVNEMGRRLVVAGDILATWFLSRTSPGPANLATVGLILLVAAAAVVVSHRKLRDSGSSKAVLIGSAGLFSLVYTGFIAFCGAGLSWDPEQRHMAPAYVFVMLLVFAGGEDLFRLLGKWWGRPLVQSVGLVLMALWLLYPLDQAAHIVKHAMRDGAGEYTNRLWEESSLIHWLRTKPLQGPVYSNIPDGLYLLAGIPANDTPSWCWDAAEFVRAAPSGRTCYVVWSHVFCRSHLYDLRELASRWRLEPIAEFSDGAVYRLLGVGGPELCRVFRFWSPRKNRHLYTLDKGERDEVIRRGAREWKDEGAVFYAFAEGRQPADAVPVYRLGSDALQTSFYTIDEAEKNAALVASPRIWEYRGVAWYAFAEAQRPADTCPVYRFWSDTLHTYFYTIQEAERDRLIADFSYVWTYEGVAWYAYGN